MKKTFEYYPARLTTSRIAEGSELFFAFDAELDGGEVTITSPVEVYDEEMDTWYQLPDIFARELEKTLDEHKFLAA